MKYNVIIPAAALRWFLVDYVFRPEAHDVDRADAQKAECLSLKIWTQ